MKMNDIAKILKVSLPAATGLINRMVKSKMVQRTDDPNDRRVIYIEIVSAGKNSLERVRRQRREAVAKLFATLTEKERKTYLALLKKLVKGAEANKDEK